MYVLLHDACTASAWSANVWPVRRLMRMYGGHTQLWLLHAVLEVPGELAERQLPRAESVPEPTGLVAHAPGMRMCPDVSSPLGRVSVFRYRGLPWPPAGIHSH